MRTLRSGLLALTWLTAATAPNLALATPPWQRLLPLRRIDAEQGNPYPVSEDQGPWMILAATFRGEGAEGQAKKLVHELRRNYRLDAYSHAKEFDFDEGLGQAHDRNGRPRKIRFRDDGEVREIAVLVGNFESIDDPKAQRLLNKLKYEVKPSCLTGEAEETSMSLAAVREFYRSALPDTSARRQKGPLGHSFITTNPLLPREYFAPKGIDKLVEEMNAEVQHSLLDCSGNYTLRVATFRGYRVVDPRKIEELEDGKKIRSRLADAAEKAHQLTLALRRLGYEAYEFHDREESIVAVGSFASFGQTLPDGTKLLAPPVQSLYATFAAKSGPQTAQQASYLRQFGGKYAQNALQPKTPANLPGANKSLWKGELAGAELIPLDVSPEVIETPRRSVSKDYVRTARR